MRPTENIKDKKKKGFEKLVFFFLLVVGRILLTIKKLAQLLTSPLFIPFLLFKRYRREAECNSNVLVTLPFYFYLFIEKQVSPFLFNFTFESFCFKLCLIFRWVRTRVTHIYCSASKENESSTFLIYCFWNCE